MTSVEEALSLTRTSPALVSVPQLVEALPRTLFTPRTAPAIERRQLWQRRYRLRLVLSDTTVVLTASGVAAAIQFANAQVDLIDAPWQYGRVFLLTTAIWLLLLALFQTRATRLVGQGTHEYRRVAHATGMAFGVLAIGFVLLQSQGLRTQLVVALPVGMLGLIYGRWLSRRWLVRQRLNGEYVSRALVVGRRSDVEYVVRSVHGSGLLGYRVVGVSLEDDDAQSISVNGETFRAMADASSAHLTASRLGADAVIVASTPECDAEYLKKLSWQLEGTAAELVLSSPLADVAGPRMTLTPVEGLPLIQVELATFEGSRYLLKRAMDVIISSLALLAIALITPFVALAIVIDDPGPVFFRQDRVGRDGRTFRMLKFRSMRTDAERVKLRLLEQNEGAGPLFKMKSDPRITRVGAIIRRFSIDELPQFWNVLIGDMSIVGPRPPLPSEVTAYDGMVYRRLYIKPGITGLWQVSGRSDLSWEESVRLDLRYVENWSIVTDLVILLRTMQVVLNPRGAY